MEFIFFGFPALLFITGVLLITTGVNNKIGKALCIIYPFLILSRVSYYIVWFAFQFVCLIIGPLLIVTGARAIAKYKKARRRSRYQLSNSLGVRDHYDGIPDGYAIG